MPIPIPLGEIIPLKVYWVDKTRDDLIVKAQVYQRIPNLLLATDVDLSYIPLSDAVYQNSTFLMPNTDIVDVRYDIFDSDGTTLLTSGEEIFLLDTGSGGGGGSTVIISTPIFGTVKSLSMITGILTCENA